MSGNRNFDEAETTTLQGFCNGNTEMCAADRKKLSPSVNTANNRFNTGQDYACDAVGSITEDANGQSYVYDGENKMAQALDGNNDLLGTYYYDGDGKRVKNVVPNGETIVFVYDATRKIVCIKLKSFAYISHTKSKRDSHWLSPKLLI